MITDINREQILDFYMADVLAGREFSNVNQFAILHGFEEIDFYNYFSNFKAIEFYFFELLINKTLETLVGTEEYILYSKEEKLLSFYYTFFGNLTSNRSFVLELLKDKNWKTLDKLKNLKSIFKAFIKTLNFETLDLKQKDLNRLQDNAIAESAWVQLLAAIAYWKNDTSPRFEKTDVYIEKSLNAGFELADKVSINRIADFGKFLIKDLKS